MLWSRGEARFRAIGVRRPQRVMCLGVSVGQSVSMCVVKKHSFLLPYRSKSSVKYLHDAWLCNSYSSKDTYKVRRVLCRVLWPCFPNSFAADKNSIQ